MAEGKKGFVMYADQIGIFKKLIEKDRKDGTNYAGELAFHIFRYVNDENPDPPDFVVEMAFEPIKLQLKRDLKKWEGKSGDNSEKGIIGNLKRWQPDLYDQFIKNQITIEKALEIAENRRSDKQRENLSPNIANVAVTVNVNDNDIKNNIDSRKLAFADTLKPFLENYGKELLNEFYKYWSEPNKTNKKMRWELQKTWSVSLRLENWAKRNINFKGNIDSLTQASSPKYNKF